MYFICINLCAFIWVIFFDDKHRVWIIITRSIIIIYGRRDRSICILVEKINVAQRQNEISANYTKLAGSYVAGTFAYVLHFAFTKTSN